MSQEIKVGDRVMLSYLYDRAIQKASELVFTASNLSKPRLGRESTYNQPIVDLTPFFLVTPFPHSVDAPTWRDKGYRQVRSINPIPRVGGMADSAFHRNSQNYVERLVEGKYLTPITVQQDPYGKIKFIEIRRFEFTEGQGLGGWSNVRAYLHNNDWQVVVSEAFDLDETPLNNGRWSTNSMPTLATRFSAVLFAITGVADPVNWFHYLPSREKNPDVQYPESFAIVNFKHKSPNSRRDYRVDHGGESFVHAPRELVEEAIGVRYEPVLAPDNIADVNGES